MKFQPPPPAPHGPQNMMKAYNDLRKFIMGRQVIGFSGVVPVDSVQIVTTPHGRIIDLTQGIPGITTGGGGPGACCFAGTCSILSDEDCTVEGGLWFGPGSVCSPGICTGGGGSTGACCHGTSCSITTLTACVASGGTFLGGGCSPMLCLGCPSGMGACCDSTGGCTNTPPGGCGGTFTCGADCSTITCTPTEPDGACCQTMTSMCAVVPESQCHGIFHEFIDCSFVGSCAADFGCGPPLSVCACTDRGHGYTPPARCCDPSCDGGDYLCGTCWDPIGQLQYCCCCCFHPYPIGWVCS